MALVSIALFYVLIVGVMFGYALGHPDLKKKLYKLSILEQVGVVVGLVLWPIPVLSVLVCMLIMRVEED